jgi:putative DNA primase/helicase
MSPFCLARKIERGYEFINKSIFINCYENLENKFDLIWLADKQIRTYENCDFCPPPMKINKSTFNLFNGLDGDKLIFNYKDPIDEIILSKKSQIFIKQLWYLTGKSNQCLEYCLDYLAHVVQKAGELPRTALVFKGIQGTGKNLFFEGFSNKVLNKSYLLATAELDHIIGRFPQINQKLIALMDEAKGKDTFVGSDKIKSYITAPTLVYEKKGIDGMTINNCSRMIFLTNNENGVLIEQTDRRFVAMECATDFTNDTVYFKALVKAFDTPSMVRDFYLFLKNRDIIKFDSTNDRPITQFYKEMRTVTTPTEIKYFYQKYSLWTNGEYTYPSIIEKKGKEHYDDYTNWCSNILPTPYKPITEMSFVKRLNDKEKKEFITSKKERDTTYYHIDVAKLGVFVEKNKVEYVEVAEDEYPENYTMPVMTII